MDDNLYDEFGNYIGPEIEEEAPEQRVPSPPQPAAAVVEDTVADDDTMMDAEHAQQRTGFEISLSEPITKPSDVVLHEDKNYYPSAEQLYGPDTEILVQDEDTQPLEKPIIERVKTKRWELIEHQQPSTIYDTEYLVACTQQTENIRNVALIGHLHHGKTSFMDMLVQYTHPSHAAHHLQQPNRSDMQPLHYTNTRYDERRRGISIKAMPMSFLLPNMQDKHVLVNVMDAPGHANFVDEACAAIRMSDGIVLVVDVVEGVMATTEQLLRVALLQELPLVLVLNKVDRLIVELKLPPQDAYYKLRHVIQEVNAIVEALGGKKLSPELNNVIFASSLHGWSFTCLSFAHLYGKHYKNGMDCQVFASKLWGDICLDEQSRKFVPFKSQQQPRSFVQFVLEPIYKLYSHMLGKDLQDLPETLRKMGIALKQQMIKTLEQQANSVQPLLKHVFASLFGAPKAFVQTIAQHIPHPLANQYIKLKHTYQGPLPDKQQQQQQEEEEDDSTMGRKLVHATSQSDLCCLMICKLYHQPGQANKFDALARVMSGTLQSSASVKLFGEHEEDTSVALVNQLYLYQSRYKIALASASMGNWVLLEGIDATLNKTATVIANNNNNNITYPMHRFKPLSFPIQAVIKLAVEPLNPSNLPKLVEGLRNASKSYPLLQTKVEESGEHVMLGTGEMYMDCVMHDLRHIYAQIEIKVSDPIVSFCETVLETSSITCYAETPNQMNRLTMIAEPMEKGLVDDLEHFYHLLHTSKKQQVAMFAQQYSWDALTVKNLWAFGPDLIQGPNVLFNETYVNHPEYLSTAATPLDSIRDSIIQGFQWATKEGPLCDETIRNVKFRLLDVTLAEQVIHRGSVQMIPTARRCCHASFLMASARMMEPVYAVEILSPLDSVKTIYTILERRRGHVTQDVAKAGTPLYAIKALVPAMDHFGLETDIRTLTQGQAFCSSHFHHWSVVPGDPLDKSIVLKPLEPSPPQYLAREFMLKTRRRKGLSDDVSLNKYFDQDVWQEIVAQGMDQDMQTEALKQHF